MQWLHCGGLKIQFSVGATVVEVMESLGSTDLLKEIFPSGWTIRVYIRSSIPFNSLFLLTFENVISQLHDQAVCCAIVPQCY